MIKRLDTMKPAELQRIAVANKGKKVLVIVHPYWGNSGPHWETQNPKFDRFVHSGRHQKYITVVMEHHQDIPKLRKRLEKAGLKESNSFFIVGTKWGMPNPTHGWQKLIRRLEALGARDVIVSGRDIERYKVEDVLREMNREEGHRNRDRYSKIRTIKKAASQSHAYSACAGITFSKIKASGRFPRVKLSRHFR